MRQHIVCGIDIGNFAVKTVIAEINPELSHPKIIGAATVVSQGLRKGIIVDMEEAIRNVHDSIKRAETVAGVKVEKAYVAVNGLHIGSQLSHGVIIVSRADNEISQHDIDRLIEAASTISMSANREVIHRIPKSFIIDGQEYVKNALGMKGVRLEADVLLIQGLAPYMNNIAKCVNANDIEVAEFVFVPLALSRSVLDKHQREHGVLNIDCGEGVSTLSLFHEGDLIHSAVLPVGSRYITHDLAVALQIPMEQAEIIKCRYGSVGEDIKATDILNLSDLLQEDNVMVPRKQIAKIIDARVAELFDLVDEELKKVPYKYSLPAGVVLSGGGAKLQGLLAYAKNRLHLPGHIGSYNALENTDSMAVDPSFATAVGLAMWGYEREFVPHNSFFSKVSHSWSPDWLHKGIKWLKNFMP